MTDYTEDRDRLAKQAINNDLFRGSHGVIHAAANLLTEPEDRPNPEYDRALVELTTDLLGISQAYREHVHDALWQYAGYGPVDE